MSEGEVGDEIKIVRIDKLMKVIMDNVIIII